MSAVVDQIAALFEHEGAQAYLGEPVSIAEHMLQTAHEAELADAPSELVAAALLHDIGHLLHGMAHDAADHGIDTVHEEVGARWLGRAFPPAVTEPIRLHVAAKRYLCAVDAAYLTVLSPASVHSLSLQGGPFAPREVDEFQNRPHAAGAVQIRRWDDAGKVAERPTPDFDHFRAVLEDLLSQRA